MFQRHTHQTIFFPSQEQTLWNNIRFVPCEQSYCYLLGTIRSQGKRKRYILFLIGNLILFSKKHNHIIFACIYRRDARYFLREFNIKNLEQLLKCDEKYASTSLETINKMFIKCFTSTSSSAINHLRHFCRFPYSLIRNYS